MRVLLVDDHALFREGLRLILANIRPGLELDTAADLREGERMAQASSYDLVLLDLKMPGEKGISAISHFLELAPGCRVAALTGETDPLTVRSVIEAGAMGFIPKTISPENLASALQLVLSGMVYLPPEIMLAYRMSSTHPLGRDGPVAPDLGLTPRQFDVLKLLVHGASNKRIARALDIAEATVKTHVTAGLRALDVANRTEAVYASAKLGLDLSR